MRTLPTSRDLQGNQACALGAVAAGCRFYAGYPITPSSEIAETMSVELPKAGGVFIQMEDEIASMGAVLGAAMGGAKAMTATSGPGFSLKQENLGYAAGAEIPCVVVNVMRGGPSTGLPTRPSQGDIMQARWGTHGDHAVKHGAVVGAIAHVAQEVFRGEGRANRVDLDDEIADGRLEVHARRERAGRLGASLECCGQGEKGEHGSWHVKLLAAILTYLAREAARPIP